MVQDVARHGWISAVPVLNRTKPSQRFANTLTDSPSSTSAGSSFCVSAPRAKTSVVGEELGVRWQAFASTHETTTSGRRRFMGAHATGGLWRGQEMPARKFDFGRAAI